MFLILPINVPTMLGDHVTLDTNSQSDPNPSDVVSSPISEGYCNEVYFKPISLQAYHSILY